MRTTRTDFTDAGFVAALGALALLGFATTFAGRTWLAVGGAGLGAGLLLSHLVSAARKPVLVLAAAVVVAFFAGGVPLVLPGAPLTAGTVRTLAESAVYGWKQLLTTLPPVTEARLVVVPWILGLVCGAAGSAVALRVAPAPGRAAAARAAAPVAVPALTLGLVILLGTHEPAARLADGVGFAVLALLWTTVRLGRVAGSGRARGGRRAGRILAGAAVLGLAAAAASAAGPVLAAGTDREVLRDQVVPPFDIGAYPSPLVGFRKYTRDANQLWDQPLFTVTGLPDATPVRIALLDDYDGSVWGAGGGTGRTDGGYQRVGTTFGPVGGTTVRVTIAAAYAAATDLNPWLPGAGTAGSIEFAGARRAALAESLRVNLAASTGLVTARLATGDSYTVRTTVAPVPLPEDAQPAGRPTLTESAQALLSSKVATWTRGAAGRTAQLRAVAAYLRANGAYTDGGPGEGQYLPGHSLGRLTAFFNANRPVGNDEQYAAAYALVANYLGMPARVVLGATPGPGGVVRGSDVHAWVEVHVAGGWATVPQTEFMPDVSKKPEQQPPQAAENTDAIIVPPPNAARQPTSTTDTSRTDPRTTGGDRREMPWWQRWWRLIAPAVTYGGPPVLVVLLAAGAVIGWKARRRYRRRTRGPVTGRYSGGWRELVDAARDLGADVPAGGTRQEEAVLLADRGLGRVGPARPGAPGPDVDLGRLATAADAAVYGAGEPPPAQAAEFWREIDAARRLLTRSGGRWRRVRAALSPRSLRPRRRRRHAAPPTRTVAVPGGAR
ncbi:transglutaminase-like domain-containing protein [Dactylosporangium sp. NPDC000521]|uniref:transglutaminase-like domain-containing protein n=1 Tax=Dactylosporangium sp. NPDC000521 TaxID=3363975 RepID=UPI00368BD4CD